MICASCHFIPSLVTSDTLVELTEKLLVSLGGWTVMKEARALHAAGRVTEASYDPPALRGKISEGGKQFLAGLRLRNSIDIENLCPCRESRGRGLICAHSVAIGLQVLNPVQRGSAAGHNLEGAGPSAPPTAANRRGTDEIPTVELTLEGSLRHLEAQIQFRYATPGVSNPAEETKALSRLIALGFADYKGKAALQGEDAVVKFFATGLPELKKSWQVREGERFQHVTQDLVRIEPHFAIREKDDGWLDFHIHYTAGKDAVFSAADLDALLKSGKPHARLKDGRIAIADPALAADLEEVLRDCNPRQERGAYRIPPAQREYLESSFAAWRRRESDREGDQGFSASLPPLPSSAIPLRPYQVEGARWLLGKAQRGSGGLLADEMGLGKTVQTLALVEALTGPVLVVCPSSLVWNWKREAAHFLPSLPVLTIDGPSREKLFPAIPAHRLIVTSYALLRRDIEQYRGVEFAAVILDEAQHIKNPDSQNAKAACALRARSRFILTGTPIENSLRDLWSLFEFLLPGYLGARQDFRDRYETPLLNTPVGDDVRTRPDSSHGGTTSVSSDQSTSVSSGHLVPSPAPSPTWERLQRRIRPYLLRRLKKDILTELPDKIEQVLEVELTEKQKTAYTQLQQTARTQIDQLKDQGGAARMRVLTALLRLRQACCDLRLLGAPDGATSAKMDALLELLGEAIDGGHRVLVFSQFASMLDLIAATLDENAIPHCRLDGSTKNRGEVVERFQTDPSIPVFLISLKAGGVGLNLTAADTVIHFDPWWNPAAEAQATDRAHRIGQQNVVTSIKLIARDTVEERVLRMQEKKRAIIAGALDTESALGTLSPDDLRELVG
jgi:SNF2 family DNA or RNA helicase